MRTDVATVGLWEAVEAGKGTSMITYTFFQSELEDIIEALVYTAEDLEYRLRGEDFVAEDAVNVNANCDRIVELARRLTAAI